MTVKPSTELVPFTEMELDSVSDPGQYVVLACERAIPWLASAVAHGDIESVVEIRSRAEMIRVYTRQKDLGHEAELSAQEIVQRAQRGIGVCIRRGQEAGEIETRQEGAVRAGRISAQRPLVKESLKEKPSVSDFVSPAVLSGNKGTVIYAMTDGVSDEQFEEAITEAKAESNLSQANVIRKIKGVKAPPAPPASRTPTGRHLSLAGTRHLNSDRIVDTLVEHVVALCSTLELANLDELDPTKTSAWAESLAESMKVLRHLLKELTK